MELNRIAWEFDFDGNSEGWNPGLNSHMQINSISNGALNITSTGDDPQLISFPIKVFADQGSDTVTNQLYYTTLEVVVSSSTHGTRWLKAFWGTGNGFDETNAYGLSIYIYRLHLILITFPHL